MIKRLSVCCLEMGLLLASGCMRAPSNADVFNEPAALPVGAPLQALEWKVITSSIDAPNQTMSILFGNDAAIASARAGAMSYPVGSVLTLVTWTQKEDGHWFGARIPKNFKTMEVVKVTAGADGKTANSYERFEGQTPAGSGDVGRTDYILGQRASVMP
jgi:Cytochrome P460